MLDRKLLNLMGFAGVMALGSGTFAAIAHHPGTSTKGSTTAQNQINLTSDPINPTTSGDDPSPPTASNNGYTTSIYDPSMLNITSITAEPGYGIDSISVQTTASDSPEFDTYTFFSPVASYPLPIIDDQAGAVQVQWSLDPTNGSPMVDPTDGGDLTHMITFGLTPAGVAAADNATPSAPLNVMLADVPSMGGADPSSTTYSPSDLGTFQFDDQYTEDDITDPNNPVTLATYDADDLPPGTFNSSDMVTITGPLDQVAPEPSCLALLGVSGTLLLRRNRRII